MTDGLTIGSGISRAKWRDAIAAHQPVTFFVLAFVLSWYPWIIALARGQTSGPNPLGPLIAALIVSGIANGWPGVRDLLSRMVRARFGLRWYAVIFWLWLLMGLARLCPAVFAEAAHAADREPDPRAGLGALAFTVDG